VAVDVSLLKQAATPSAMKSAEESRESA